MINHKRPKQSLWAYDNQLKSFKIEAFGDIEAGSELFDSYGKKCNSRFLLNYGFIEDDNDANEFTFVIDFDDTFPLYKEKVAMIPKIENYCMKIKVDKDFEKKTFFEFISFLRFVLIDNTKELKEIYVKQRN